MSRLDLDDATTTTTVVVECGKTQVTKIYAETLYTRSYFVVFSIENANFSFRFACVARLCAIFHIALSNAPFLWLFVEAFW